MASFSPLRVLHITVSDHGGAGVACIRLHRGLLALNVESRVLVRRRSGSDDLVMAADSRCRGSWRFRLDRLPLLAYPRRRPFAWWSVNWLHRPPRISFPNWEPDIIHAHWIGDGFVPMDWLGSLDRPVVWTMHDMWPFTGGCHYAHDCERYRTGCGVCPQLGSDRENDLSFRTAARKTRALSKLRGTIIAPSRWLADAARNSVALRHARIEMIPYVMDGRLFKPGSKAAARRQLGLRDDERILLTGAVGAVTDERKGFALLTQALRECRKAGAADKWRLLVFGADVGPGEEAIGVPVTYCGTVKVEEDLPRIYHAADVFVLPSLQDNLPNTVLEALGCGKPVVGFRSSGLATMIEDKKTGWLAEPFSTESLAAALSEALDVRDEWSAACRDEFQRLYAWPGPAAQHIRLYAEMLDR